ncbi:hypothetical protein [Streptomyces sp. NPDC002057]|uniref:hypothetical protein n=1 Tax=Streptomyces sp. NPDC002057 TaxID=3154664 RepID=UPI003325A24B
MSDLYEEFDADAEEALDALLARHQSSFGATVGPALDVPAGLRRAAKRKGSLVEYVVDLRAAQNIAEGRCAVWVADNHVTGPAAESSSLNNVLDSVRHEHNELRAFEHQLVVRSATGGLETDALPVRAAVSGARSELDRILLLLSDGEVTKESARAEFTPVLRVLEGQLRTPRYVAGFELGNELSDWALWINDCLNTRIKGLMAVREQVVRLFEDSDACAFQFS